MEMMRCGVLKMTLTRPGCARLWESANLGKAPEVWEARHACRNCTIGAANAGRTVAAAAVLVDELRLICARCLRPAERLIGARHCVSCFNRTREVIKGRNGKGSRPRLTDVLHTETVVVVEGDVERMVRQEMIVGPVELMISVARRATAPVSFARPAIAADWLPRDNAVAGDF